MMIYLEKMLYSLIVISIDFNSKHTSTGRDSNKSAVNKRLTAQQTQVPGASPCTV